MCHSHLDKSELSPPNLPAARTIRVGWLSLPQNGILLERSECLVIYFNPFTRKHYLKFKEGHKNRSEGEKTEPEVPPTLLSFFALFRWMGTTENIRENPPHRASFYIYYINEISNLSQDSVGNELFRGVRFSDERTAEFHWLLVSSLSHWLTINSNYHFLLYYLIRRRESKNPFFNGTSTYYVQKNLCKAQGILWHGTELCTPFVCFQGVKRSL